MSSVKEDYLGRLDSELVQLRSTEEELNNMTMLEMELIQRLQEKQREQEKAYQRLETVLGMPGGGGAAGGAQTPLA